MVTTGNELAERLRAFNQEMIDLLKSVPDDKWMAVCEDEQWSIGVVARHVGVGHYSVAEFAKMMIAKSPMPELSHAQVDEMNKAHADKHAQCTKDEVISIFEKKGQKTGQARKIRGLLIFWGRLKQPIVRKCEKMYKIHLVKYNF